MTKCQLLWKFTSLLITSITQLAGFQLIQLLEAPNEQQTARHGNVSKVFHSFVKDQMLILFKLLSPAKRHSAEHTTTAQGGGRDPIFVLSLNRTAFLGGGSCGNSVDQGVFLLQGLFCIL